MEPDSKRKVSRGRGAQALLTTLAIGLATLVGSAPPEAVATAHPGTVGTAKAAPVKSTVQKIELGRGALASQGRSTTGEGVRADSYATDEIDTDPFSVAAVTWDADSVRPGMEIRLRTRSGGQWSSWSDLHDDGHAPDPGSAEDASARRGTDPVLAPDSDAVDI
ncbi:MAG: hypothetical protein ACRDO1_21185, partial [Nocardioidaceae bacterium]